MPVAFIDFDTAHAGSRLEDVGYAAWFWTDIGNDEMPADEQGRRVADFFRHYGLDTVVAIDAMTRAQTALAVRTDSAGVRQWAEACRVWVESHRNALSAAIAGHSRRSP
jgi:aminoglycoside phosphotransferase (APT) family kinase protein